MPAGGWGTPNTRANAFLRLNLARSGDKSASLLSLVPCQVATYRFEYRREGEPAPSLVNPMEPAVLLRVVDEAKGDLSAAEDRSLGELRPVGDADIGCCDGGM